MKITKRQLRRIIKEEKTTVLVEQAGPAMSYIDFAARLKEIHALTESLGLVYVDSGWLADGDHASLAEDVNELDRAADSLALAAEGLARSMEEM